MKTIKNKVEIKNRTVENVENEFNRTHFTANKQKYLFRTKIL